MHYPSLCYLDSQNIFLLLLLLLKHTEHNIGATEHFQAQTNPKKTVQKSVPSCVNWQLRFRGQMPSRQHAVLVHNTGTLHKTKQVWPQERKGKERLGIKTIKLNFKKNLT